MVISNTKLRWWIILVLTVVDVLLIAGLKLRVSISDLYKPLGFSLLLTVLGFIYEYRKEPKFVLVLVVLNHLVLFGWSYMVFLYSGASLNRPLFDDYLVHWDHLLGYHEAGVVSWVRSHPLLNHWLNVAYNTLLIQTGFVIAVLGLSGEREQLDAFMLRLMVSSTVAALIFIVFPAVGPFEVYGYTPDEGQMRYLTHFLQLRSGERLTVTAKEPEGLITFPSFHTTWAILLALAFRHRPILFVIGVILNLAVIVSTLTSGWHYLSDVLAGVLVAVVTILMTNWLDGRLGDQLKERQRGSERSSPLPGAEATDPSGT